MGRWVGQRGLIGGKPQPVPSSGLPIAASVLLGHTGNSCFPGVPQACTPGECPWAPSYSPNLTGAANREEGECELGQLHLPQASGHPGCLCIQPHIPGVLRLCQGASVGAQGCKAWLLSSQGHQPGWGLRGDQGMYFLEAPPGRPSQPWAPACTLSPSPMVPTGQVSRPPTATSVCCPRLQADQGWNDLHMECLFIPVLAHSMCSVNS